MSSLLLPLFFFWLKEKSLLKKLNAVAQPNSSPRSRSVEGNILKIKTEMDKARSEKQEALRGVNASNTLHRLPSIPAFELNEQDSFFLYKNIILMEVYIGFIVR